MKKVKLNECGKEVECWVYLLHHYKPYMMQLPFLDDYRDDDQDKKFVENFLRESGFEYWSEVKLDQV